MNQNINIKISIITVVYNCVDTIEETILSVLNQTAFSNVEYIIVDGKSNDGTQDIIEKYESELDFYISEKDSGLYDAMNKGMKAANGNFCLFLNAGDVLYRKNILEKYITNIVEMNMVYFATAVMTDRKQMYRLVPDEKIDPNSWVEQGGLPNHQAMLFPKEFYKNEKYDLQFRISADDDYKIRALKEYPSCYIPIWAVLFELGGLSRSFSSWKHIKQRMRELGKIHAKHPHAPSTNTLDRYKYNLKILGVFILTRITGFNNKYELAFNKFKRIELADIEKFNINFN